MKKFYLLATALLFLGLVNAQKNSEGPVKHNFTPKLSKEEYLARSSNKGGSRCTTNSYYLETFDDPFNHGWTVTGAGSSGGTYVATDMWLQDFDGPNGHFSSTQEIITSPSANDGFMILDGDYLNGQGFQPQVGTIETHQAQLISPVYDLTGTPNVSMSFFHSYRYCCSDSLTNLFVEISTDGFANVSASYNVTYPYAKVNVMSGTKKFTLNITDDIVGDPSNVQIRFRWGTVGATSTNPSHYYWQIDDLNIFESYSHHATVDSLSWSNVQPFYGYYWGFQQVPSFMSQTTSITLTASLTNIGSSDWTNAVMQLNENGQSLAQSNPQFIASGSSSNFSLTQSLPFQVGIYHYDVFLSDTASFCDSDTLNAILSVTPDFLSAGSTFPNGIQSGTNWTWIIQPVRVGFGGKVYNSYTGSSLITGVRVAFEDTTINDFAQMEAMILIDGMIVHTQNFNVDVADYGGYQQVDFPAPIAVDNGDIIDYLIVDNNGQARFIQAGSSLFSFGLLATFDGSNTMNGPYIENPIMAGLVMTVAAGLEDENDQSISILKQNFPNPFDENTMIQFSLTSNEVCLFEIRDVTGKLVKSMDLGIQNAGQHQIELKSAEFGEGIYFYTLTAGKQRMTKKMVVLK